VSAPNRQVGVDALVALNTNERCECGEKRNLHLGALGGDEKIEKSLE